MRRIFYGTQRQAVAFQAELRLTLDEAVVSAPKMTLSDYAKSWFAIKVTQVRPATANKYLNDLEKHILPVLGQFYIDTLRPSDIALLVADSLEKTSGWSVTNRLKLLRMMSKDAVVEGITQRDFCARVRSPKCSNYTEEEPNMLSAGELDKLVGVLEEPWKTMVITMGFTGLRWGEVSGLKWEDIDETREVIAIRRTNWKGKVGQPKTISSRRTIPACSEVLEALKAHRKVMVAEQHPGLADGWVFPSKSGKLHLGTPLRKVLRQAADQIGIEKRFTPHGLRRTFNDLVRRVASKVVVKSITGHTTDRMMEHYSMVDAEEKKEAQRSVLKLVRKSSVEGSETKTGQ